MTHTLVVDDVEAAYRGHTVLRQVSLETTTGEFVALVGPNGSGKSTLLKAASGSLTPARGAVTIDGEPLASLSPRARAHRIAMLPQSPPLPEGLTVRELVEHGRHAHRTLLGRRSATDRHAIDDAVDATGLEPLADRRLETLSGGERQRAWIAMTLAQQAPLVLLDEPTTFLDIGHQLELLALLERLSVERGLGVLVVLHDLTQAARFADRTVVLDRGEVVASGPPQTALTVDVVARHFGVRCTIEAIGGGRVHLTPVAPVAAHD